MSNAREAFRLDMYDAGCLVSNDYNVSKGYIKNISDVGIAVEVDIDYFDSVCEVNFELDHQEFYKSCRIVRKRPLSSGRTFIALNFEQSDQERKDLFQKILKLDAIRTQNSKELD